MLDKFKTIIFDCDGVVLNSNIIKTEAFYKSAIKYGDAAAKALVHYHIMNGGVSRYKKFTYFLEYIAPKTNDDLQSKALNDLLVSYSKYVREGLMTCEIAQGLSPLRNRYARTRMLVVSGGDQSELRDVFFRRNIRDFFDGGIFGSPDTKDEILYRELSMGNIILPCVMLGDSKYDYEAAKNAGLDFIFISEWSELADWRSWVRVGSINNVSSLDSLI